MEEVETIPEPAQFVGVRHEAAEEAFESSRSLFCSEGKLGTNSFYFDVRCVLRTKAGVKHVGDEIHARPALFGEIADQGKADGYT
jgi:hypothetical protein